MVPRWGIASASTGSGRAFSGSEPVGAPGSGESISVVGESMGVGSSCRSEARVSSEGFGRSGVAASMGGGGHGERRPGACMCVSEMGRESPALVLSPVMGGRRG